MERINNTSWCCDEIEELIKTYKKQCQILRGVGEVSCRAKAETYYRVIRDLETILYGESYYE